jgi:hypothetical protein
LPNIHPVAAQKVRSLLFSDEQILWAGIPNPRLIFHKDDFVAVPFSLLWLLLVTRNFSSHPAPETIDPLTFLWRAWFLAIGHYALWGRFFHHAWLKTRTFYAVTNRRALFIQNNWTERCTAVFPTELSTIRKEGMSIGTIWFDLKYEREAGSRRRKRKRDRLDIDPQPAFADIDDVDDVYQLLMETYRQACERAQPLDRPILSFPG